MAATDWLRYANQGATRSLPLNNQLIQALGFLPELGVTMEVFSGGQPGKGSGLARIGSTRHDHGNAADVFFYKDGRRINWASDQDRPIFEEIVRRGKAAGITGFGAGPGYMREGSMHIGFGSPGVWGAGGRGANAPDWLTSAYNGATLPERQYAQGTTAQQPAAPPQAPGTPAPAFGAPVAIDSAPAPSVPSPASTPAPPASEPSPMVAQMLGAMAMQPQGPQFSPVQIQGPSPQQAMALTEFIRALKNRAIA